MSAVHRARRVFAVLMVGLIASVAVGQGADPAASPTAPTGDTNEDSIGVKERFTYATCITCILSFLILCTVIFEWIKDMVLESATEQLRPILNQMFSEMTVLGFIGIVAFFINKAEFLDNISENVFGTSEEEKAELKEMFENVHMMIFLVMIIFIVQVLKSMLEGGKILRHWRLMQDEGFGEAKFTELKSKYKDILSDLRAHPLEPFGDPRRGTYERTRSLLEFNALRKAFIQGDSNENKENALPHDFDFANYLATSMGLVLAEMVELPLYTWLGLEIIALVFYLIQTVCPRVVLLWVWIAFGAALVFALACLSDHIDWIKSQLIPDSAYAGIPEHQIVNQIVGPTSPLRRVVKWLLCGCGCFGGASSVALPRGSRPGAGSLNAEGVPLIPTGSSSQYGSSADGGSKPYLRRPPCTHRTPLQMKFLGPPPNKQEMLFWLDVKGVATHLFMLRIANIGTSVYLSILFYQFVPFAREYYAASPLIFAIVIIVAIVPVLLLFGYYSPEVIRNHTFVTSIEMMKRPKIIRRIIREQKTQKSIRALILLNQMRVAHERQTQRQVQNSNPEEARRRRAESLAIMDASKRVEMEKMFDLYDDDNSGEIDTEELGQLMKSLGRVMTEPELRSMFAELDEDNDGHVSKNEFLTWAALQDSECNKEGSEHDSIEELAEDMFRMFDPDNDGEVTVEEFAECMNRFGSALTVDEISDLVHELDENQDGTINVEEFSEMLKKHAADWR